ncbi:helix-turn-helix transcriptional regulator [uncultured Adlercreutzia sp.]|uniref:helix-turn-helix transcriptional regulator n=1 Tax=uncultured Adlercreutzia sp. TaxID=875803 RepID=UPI0025F8C679|nr:helix-turn-helix transcriptional regulator [uncultured Adlercreutzia sp.]
MKPSIASAIAFFLAMIDCLLLAGSGSPLFIDGAVALSASWSEPVARAGAPLVLALCVLAGKAPSGNRGWAVLTLGAAAGSAVATTADAPWLAFAGYVPAAALVACSLGTALSSLRSITKPLGPAVGAGAIVAAFFATAVLRLVLAPAAFAFTMPCLIALTGVAASLCARARSETPAIESPLWRSLKHGLPAGFLLVATSPLCALANGAERWPVATAATVVSLTVIGLSGAVWRLARRHVPPTYPLFCFSAVFTVAVSFLYQYSDPFVGLVLIGITLAFAVALLALAAIDCLRDASTGDARGAIAAILVAQSLSGIGFSIEAFASHLGGASYQIVLLVSTVALVVGVALCSPQRKKGSPAAAADEGDTSDHLDRAIDAASDAFHLTQRQREVFQLLAKGRNVPFIADSLCLSPNTVRTYKKELYYTLGVHSQQELIDLVTKGPDQAFR